MITITRPPIRLLVPLVAMLALLSGTALAAGAGGGALAWEAP